MAGKYAASTSVSVEKTRNEIERTLARWGATMFAYGWDQRGSVIEFSSRGRRLRFVLMLPDRQHPDFTRHSRGWRTVEAAEAAWEQACRQHWRALLLVIKAKLEAVEIGISGFDEEFLSNVVTTDGRTIGERLVPRLDEVIAAGPLALLPGPS